MNFKTVAFLLRIVPVVARVFVSPPQSELAAEENASLGPRLGVWTVTRFGRLSSRHSWRVLNRARFGVSVFCASLPTSFEYLCSQSTAITNIFILRVWGTTLDVRILRLQTSDSDVLSRSPHCKR